MWKMSERVGIFDRQTMRLMSPAPYLRYYYYVVRLVRIQRTKEMAKGFRNLNRRAKPRNCGVGLIAVFILVALTYVTMARTTSMRFSLGNSLPLSQLDLPAISSTSHS
ncbi:hypothetical protein BHE74_00043709 [Ensete ventricosum]|nr:hypothetical protein BHE74_00043709 [Ensete ventricosum]RZR98082.1 hypothetical protein BHM03_00027388 [Ensete ventricosum]